MLTLWANPEVQRELLLNVRNNKVYTCLSSKLALLGFNKAPKKCREKIKKLKQEYKRIKNGQYRGGSSSVWFAIMDEVLSSQALTAKRSQTVQNSSTVHSLAVQAVALDVDTDGKLEINYYEITPTIKSSYLPNCVLITVVLTSYLSN